MDRKLYLPDNQRPYRVLEFKSSTSNVSRNPAELTENKQAAITAAEGPHLPERLRVLCLQI